MLHSNQLDDLVTTRVLLALVGVLVAGLVFLMVVAAALVTGLSISDVIARAADALFAVSSVQALWYVTRAAGIMAYLLLWLSTAWGLGVAGNLFDPLLGRNFTYDFHQFISLLAIGFTFVHVVVLLADKYLPFSLAAILIPFVAPYRPLWVSVGIMAFYLALLVTVTFYMRRQIGMRAFRSIHLASFISFGGAALHGLMAGTDSVLLPARLMYAGTVLVIVFLTAYWLLFRKLSGSASHAAARAS